MVQASSMTSPSHSARRHSVTGARLVTHEGRELPLRSAKLSADACGGIARVLLTQRFANDSSERLAVRYLLPLPADGAVSGYRFRLDGREIVGEVDRKHAARERFEEALVSGRTAALLEQERADLFTQELGNIPPGKELEVEVTIDQPLIWLEEGSWEWRFPTVVGPRFMGEAGRVADAEKITVDVSDAPLNVRLQLALVIGDVLATGRPESPSHHLTSSMNEASHTRVQLEAHDGARLDRDLVVRWPVAALTPGVSLHAARPASSRLQERTYALLTLVPPAPAANAKVLPRDLIFLIDTSGSMGGRPLEQAKRVASMMIDTLGDVDRLEMIEFGNQPRRFRKEPALMTRDGKSAAQAWIRGLQAAGGTEMQKAIDEALRPLRGDAQRQIVLITDGYVGFESQIVREILERMPKSCRLHTLGVGSSVNRTLTQGASRAGAGIEVILGLDEDPERGAKRMIERTAGPMVTELELEIDGEYVVAPKRTPDLFARCPAKIALELSPKVHSIRVRGKTKEGPWTAEIAVPKLALGEGKQQVAALYGREAVEDREMHLAAGGSVVELDAQIEKLGLGFQIATRLTSWIAVSDQQTVDPSLGLLRQTMPHELAAGLERASFGLAGTGDLLDGFIAGGAPPAKVRASIAPSAPAAMRSQNIQIDEDAKFSTAAPKGLRSSRDTWIGLGVLFFLILVAIFLWWFS